MGVVLGMSCDILLEVEDVEDDRGIVGVSISACIVRFYAASPRQPNSFP
jgi:hypothetical protein